MESGKRRALGVKTGEQRVENEEWKAESGEHVCGERRAGNKNQRTKTDNVRL